MPIDCPRLQFPLRLVLTHMYHVICITYVLSIKYMYYVSRIYYVLCIMALSPYVKLYWVSPNDYNHLEWPPHPRLRNLCTTPYVLHMFYVLHMYFVLHMYYCIIYMYVLCATHMYIIIMLTCLLLHMCYNLVDRPTQLFYIWIFIFVNMQITGQSASYNPTLLHNWLHQA